MEDHKEVFEIVSGNFDIVPHNVLSMNQVRDLLASRVREMLDKNIEKLVSTLYRIDVSQRVTDEIFNLTSKDDIALLIADAVIERQLKKIETRKKYKNDANL
ncbi:MAG TPA: hypothetical protein PKA39_02820 [Ignavibacteria bacterium]|jgi:hypothetical protein|nr:hypothetical protein [Ignavibacteria bacterium]